MKTIEQMTDAEIRANIRYQEEMTKKFVNELGFVPDEEDWEVFQ